MQHNENLIDLLAIIYKWRKKIIFATLLAAIGTVIISLLLPNWYKSTTVFYAASPDLAKPVAIGNNEAVVNFYGTDTDLDRLFSIANSAAVYDYLIKEFDLYQHYEIDSTDAKAAFKLREKLAKLYQTKKNKYDALELSVEDKDISFPHVMANAARNKINALSQNLIKSGQKQQIEGYEANIVAKEKQLTDLSSNLTVLRKKYKIYNINAQSEHYASAQNTLEGNIQKTSAKVNALSSNIAFRDSVQFLKAVLKGYNSQLSKLENDINLFNTGYTEVLSSELQQKDMIDQLSYDKERFKQLKSSYDAAFPGLHVVQEAVQPIHKSRPKRSIIVLGITMMAFVLSCLWVILMHQYRELDWKKITS